MYAIVPSSHTSPYYTYIEIREQLRKGYVVVFCLLFCCVRVVLCRVLFAVQGKPWRRDFQAPVFAKAIGYARVERTILENVVNA